MSHCSADVVSRIKLGVNVRVLGRLINLQELAHQYDTTEALIVQDFRGIGVTAVLQVHSCQALSHTFDLALLHKVLAKIKSP